jgi:hypothetical protein
MKMLSSLIVDIRYQYQPFIGSQMLPRAVVDLVVSIGVRNLKLYSKKNEDYWSRLVGQIN